MTTRTRDIRSLRELLDRRGLTMDAAAVLGRVDTSTISRICSGQARATPQTIVNLAKGLGVGAHRMARICDGAWIEREGQPSGDREGLRRIDIGAMAAATEVRRT